MIQVRVEYFAVLREHVGVERETVTTSARTVDELYGELDQRHGFPAIGRVKAAVNEEFREWSAPLHDGDVVVFIPPVAGG